IGVLRRAARLRAHTSAPLAATAPASKASGPGMQLKPGNDFLRSECEMAWRDFSQQPGAHLQYTRSFWSGVCELRTAERQPMASLKGASLRGGPVRTTVSLGGRTFTN